MGSLRPNRPQLDRDCPGSKRHPWVLSMSPNTSVASFTLSLTCVSQHNLLYDAESPGQLLHFSLCSFRSWRTSFHPSAPEEALGSHIPEDFSFDLSINFFTSALCVEERVGIVGNGYTLRTQFHLSSLRSNFHLVGSGIHGRIRLAQSNTNSDVCVQYALPDQSPEGAGSWSHMAPHLGRVKLTSASPPYGSEKTPPSGAALPEGRHTGTISWTVLSHRLQRIAVSSQEVPFTSSLMAPFKREPVYRVFSRIQTIFIPITWCCHTYILPHSWRWTRLQRTLLSTWDRPVYRASFK